MLRRLRSASVSLVACASLCPLTACGDDGGAGGGGTGGGGTTASTAETVTVSTGGVGGGGGEACVPEPYEPTPEAIQFEAVAPLPSGEHILFNDWNETPNAVYAIDPDGQNELEIFRAYRVWSMGVSNDGSTIAFSSGDPEQAAHFCITIGDAIQHTFLYDVEAEEAEALSDGNVNDECHVFGPGDQHLYLCRRYDFPTDDGFAKGYRVGRYDLGTRTWSFLTPDEQPDMTLHPAPLPDGDTVLVTQITSGARSIRAFPVTGGASTELRASAGSPTLSPDGTRIVFSDYTQQGALVVRDLATDEEVTVSDDAGTSARWSPDGTRIAYTIDDDAVSCQHVDVVAADGSEASAPTRIHDCVTSGRFITDLAWVTR